MSEDMFCPYCLEKHEMETVHRQVKATHKGITFQIDETVYECPRTKEIFVDEKLLNENNDKVLQRYEELQHTVGTT